MVALTTRQQTAARLTRELQAFGATVTNVLPLEEGKNLRFWVSDYCKNEVLQQLKDAGYNEPLFLGMSPQICTATYSMGLVNNFELPIATERQEIPSDGRISRDEIGNGRGRDAVIMRVYESVYGKKR
jgi:hypothetical protein